MRKVLVVSFISVILWFGAGMLIQAAPAKYDKVENDFFDWPNVLTIGETYRMQPAKVYLLNGVQIEREPLAGTWEYVSSDTKVIKVINGHTLQAVGSGATTLTLLIKRVVETATETTTYTTKWTTSKKISVAAQSFRLADQLKRTPEQIKYMYELSKPLHRGGPFIKAPVTRVPFSIGQMSPGFLQDGLRMTNFVRYLAGLPHQLTLEPSLNRQASHGAVLNAFWNELDHTPPKPSSMNQSFYDLAYRSTTTSNLSVGIDTLHEQVRGYMDDLGLNNLAEVGHRRWILNPGLSKLGFGMAQTASGGAYYGAMQVFDVSGSANTKVEYPSINWPAAGHFPVEFLDRKAVWSASLNPAVYDSSRISNIRVRMSKVGSSRQWLLDRNDNQKTDSGAYFNVSTKGIGVPFAVMFRAAGLNFKHGEEYRVTIEGLRTKSGVATAITYNVKFFELNKVGAGNLPNFKSSAETGRTPSKAEILIYLNGQQKIYDAPPISQNGSVLVPLRGILENLGASISFQAGNQTIVARRGERTVRLRVGQRTATVDGKTVNIAQSPISRNGRVFVPLRFVSESFQANVRWEPAYNAVVIQFVK